MKILTANRLTDGIAVWLADDHGWSECISKSCLAGDAATEEKLTRAGQAAFLKNEVIDVNLIDVDVVEGRIVPRRLRERIRAGGPTITVNADLPAGAPARRAA